MKDPWAIAICDRSCSHINMINHVDKAKSVYPQKNTRSDVKTNDIFFLRFD
jgi:hypothetical protein